MAPRFLARLRSADFRRLASVLVAVAALLFALRLDAMHKHAAGADPAGASCAVCAHVGAPAIVTPAPALTVRLAPATPLELAPVAPIRSIEPDSAAETRGPPSGTLL
jgi:hypothetical protein